MALPSAGPEGRHASGAGTSPEPRGPATDLYARERRRADRLHAINEVGQRIAAVLSLDELLPFVVELLRSTFGWYSVSVFLQDEATQEMVSRAVAGGAPDKIPAETRIRIGQQGIVGWVAATEQPLLANDVKAEPRYFFIEGLAEARSELAVAIKVEGQVVGVLDVQHSATDAFDPEDPAMLQAIADQVAAAIHNARLLDSERRTSARLRAVNEVGRKVTAILDLEQLLGETTRLISQTFGYHHVAVHLFDPEAPSILYQVAASTTEAGSRPFRVPLGTGMVGWAARTGQTVLANDVSASPHYQARPGLDTRSELDVPLKVAHRVIGVLNIESAAVGAFAVDDLPFLETLADQIAIAIENARLTGETRAVAIAEERNRVARELHDDTAQSLVAALRQIDLALYDLGDPAALEPRLSNLRDMIDRTLQDVRRLSRNLRPAVLEDLGLVPALEGLVADTRRHGRLQAELTVVEDARRPTTQVELGLFRIVQEALANVVKHAEATGVVVEVRLGATALQISVRDDGRGFACPANLAELGKRGGMGLLGMRDRARALGGELVVTSAPGRGTRVMVEVGMSDRSPD